MSAISQTSDGILPHGSFDITILQDGQAYVAENFNLEENSKKIQSSSARGRVSRQKVIITDSTFSADFQLADEDTDAPRPSHVFAVDADRDGVVEPYQIEKAGRVYAQEGEYKCKVSGFAMVNPLIYIPATSRTPEDRGSVTGSAITSLTLGAYVPRDVTLAATPYTATGLPTGLTCSTAGVISGTPSAIGAFAVTVKVAATRTVDGVSEALVGAAKFTWTITAP
jgi:hypothetical protein